MPTSIAARLAFGAVLSFLLGLVGCSDTRDVEVEMRIGKEAYRGRGVVYRSHRGLQVEGNLHDRQLGAWAYVLLESSPPALRIQFRSAGRVYGEQSLTPVRIEGPAEPWSGAEWHVQEDNVLLHVFFVDGVPDRRAARGPRDRGRRSQDAFGCGYADDRDQAWDDDDEWAHSDWGDDDAEGCGGDPYRDDDDDDDDDDWAEEDSGGCIGDPGDSDADEDSLRGDPLSSKESERRRPARRRAGQSLRLLAPLSVVLAFNRFRRLRRTRGS